MKTTLSLVLAALVGAMITNLFHKRNKAPALPCEPAKVAAPVASAESSCAELPSLVKKVAELNARIEKINQERASGQEVLQRFKTARSGVQSKKRDFDQRMEAHRKEEMERLRKGAAVLCSGVPPRRAKEKAPDEN